MDITPFKISIPELCVVALVGASGSGKSTWAASRFLPTEILSSDALRGRVADDQTDQSATPDAFDVLHFLADKRLTRGKLVVVDATNVQSQARKAVLALAKAQNVLAVAIALNVSERTCQARNLARTDRKIPPPAITRQCRDLRQSLRGLRDEGFRYVYSLREEDLDGAVVERTKLWNDRRDDKGPFDIIGDVHGCATELETLLVTLATGRMAKGFTRTRRDAGHSLSGTW